MKVSKGYVVLAVAASIYILYNFVITSFIVAEMDGSVSLGRTFVAEIVVFTPLALFFLVIQKLYKRQRWLFTTLSAKTIGFHLLIFVLLVLIHSTWQVYFNSILLGAAFHISTVIRDIIGFLNLRVLIYIITIGLIVGIVKIQEKEQELLQQSNLKLQLQKTSFREFELKLNPEIIYPNLDYVKQNARTKPEETSQLILSLSKQLRVLLDGIEEERIPFKRDMKFYEHYFQALQLRLDRPLKIRSNIQDHLLNFKIPSLVLMVPFLEDFFFGKYIQYTNEVSLIAYLAEESSLHTVRMVLEFQPVKNGENLAEKVNADSRIRDINELLTFYESISLKALPTAGGLSLILTLRVK